jgi:hypothetical protein
VRTLGFTITFHSRFRVGSSYARDGVDAALDRHDPLPPDHLKGVMLAAATGVLGLPTGVADQVFGSPRSPSPWSWSSAQPEPRWEFSHRHRVSIDPETHSARKDHLVLGEQAWARQARFEITQAGAIPPSEADRHILILRCAGAAVHNLGSWRRRGLGWVGVVPDDGPVSTDDVAKLAELAGRRGE